MSKHEPDEKTEKERQKTWEKPLEEKWQRDPLGAVVWAAILIWIGLVLLSSNAGWLTTVNRFLAQLSFQTAETAYAMPDLQLSAWSLIFLGVSVILFAEVLFRLFFPAYRRPVLGTIILAVILLGIALNSWILIWPVVIIIIGLAVLFRGLSDR